MNRDSRKSRKHRSRAFLSVAMFSFFLQFMCFAMFFAISSGFLKFCTEFSKRSVWTYSYFSVDAERSVFQYTLVNAPQQKIFTDNNLALYVMIVFNARS